jgi:hypothetical protein
VSANFFDRRADFAVVSCLEATAFRALRSNSATRDCNCSICGSIEAINVRSFAIDTSSSVIGDGEASAGAFNLIVSFAAVYEIADRSRDRCVRSTVRSVLLMDPVPMAEAKVDANSSLVKIRDVLDVAIFDV